MKIAIDVSPLESGHKVRGVGFYLSYLKKALVSYFPEHEYIFFTNAHEIDKSVDVVHYPYFDPFFLTVPFIKKHKTVVTVHDLTPLVFPSHFPAGVKGNFKWQIQRFNLHNVDRIIADSIASQNDITKIVGITKEKVDVAYLAADEEFKPLKNQDQRLKSVQKKYNLPKEFILYVGDVTWNKNVPLLVKAMRDIDMPLIMVGKSLVSTDFDRKNVWNNDLVEVQKIASQNNHIHMLGFVPTEDLVVLYNLATLFVFPSVYEGFGLPIVEAMQSGCPTIISKEGCMPEVGGEAVQYFHGYDLGSLKAAITNVLNSKSLQKELSEKGIAQAKKFNWKKTAEQTLTAYKKAINA
ncbi:MAG TPA: glycosyltransferase family 1 protein [Candidatus Saccharimonadales bacterium]|nr:glycosyltransferase family 1 protein [Candidatus Saccharimonadales bacterium]